MNIEVYKANTTTEVLHPVIWVLRIDVREITIQKSKENP